MNPQRTSGAPLFKVVLNHEEQYSIWPADQPNPAGWSDAEVVGTREDCLAAVASLWTDMRPLSLRQAMGQQNSSGGNDAQ